MKNYVDGKDISDTVERIIDELGTSVKDYPYHEKAEFLKEAEECRTLCKKLHGKKIMIV